MAGKTLIKWGQCEYRKRAGVLFVIDGVMAASVA